VERINGAGGTLDPSAKGVNEEEFARAVKLGVTKVNIDTDGRLVWTRVHREYFRDYPGEFDFRKPGTVFMKAYADFIVHKSNKLLSAGKLDTVRAAVASKA
jgi:fructose-bisphosphate aldolase, class II